MYDKDYYMRECDILQHDPVNFYTIKLTSLTTFFVALRIVHLGEAW